MISKPNKKYKAVLFDLDGTLLNIDIEKFIQAYIHKLAGRFDQYLDKDEFIQHLFGATAQMVENVDSSKKNEVVFYEDFCFRTGLALKEIKPIIDDFYNNDFPLLSCWGKEHPPANIVVELAKDKELKLVLATNPIFPTTAVLQRLSWSGIAVDNFDLITSMENMHFCKPNKEYYLEIASKIDCLPEDCLMAGNDTYEDLNAAKAGMETFLVEDFILKRGDEIPACNYRGKMDDLLKFIDSL